MPVRKPHFQSWECLYGNIWQLDVTWYQTWVKVSSIQCMFNMHGLGPMYPCIFPLYTACVQNRHFPELLCHILKCHAGLQISFIVCMELCVESFILHCHWCCIHHCGTHMVQQLSECYTYLSCLDTTVFYKEGDLMQIML